MVFVSKIVTHNDILAIFSALNTREYVNLSLKLYNRLLSCLYSIMLVFVVNQLYAIVSKKIIYCLI